MGVDFVGEHRTKYHVTEKKVSQIVQSSCRGLEGVILH